MSDVDTLTILVFLLLMFGGVIGGLSKVMFTQPEDPEKKESVEYPIEGKYDGVLKAIYVDGKFTLITPDPNFPIKAVAVGDKIYKIEYKEE